MEMKMDEVFNIEVEEEEESEFEEESVLFVEFDHVVSYIYGNDILLGDSHLVALYVLFERLIVGGVAV